MKLPKTGIVAQMKHFRQPTGFLEGFFTCRQGVPSSQGIICAMQLLLGESFDPLGPVAFKAHSTDPLTDFLFLIFGSRTNFSHESH